MTTKLVLIDKRTGQMAELGWMDDIKDFNFETPFFVRIHSTIQNDSLPGSPGLITPTGIVIPTGSATMVWYQHTYTPSPQAVTLSIDSVLRVRNDPVNASADFTWDNINPRPHGTMGLTVEFFTTGDPAGTKNVTGKQAALIKTGPELAAILSPDAVTGGSWPSLGPGSYRFTFWRVPTTPLWKGAHIKATSPIPSV